ncbi:peptide chain release factor 1, partial [Corallococcus praedator]
MASVLDTLLAIGLSNVAALQEIAVMLFSPPLGLLMIVAIAFGTGALAVYVMERLHRQVFLNAGVLW